MGNVAWSSVAELLRDASAGESDVPLPEPPRPLGTAGVSRADGTWPNGCGQNRATDPLPTRTSLP